MKSIEIPPYVEYLGGDCFNGCASLESITIPSSVTSIGVSCFAGCTSLAIVNNKSFVKDLPSECFKNCTSLRTINVPSTVTWLGEKCFEGCASLEHISIPSPVNTIGNYCFSNSGLKNIDIPKSITSLRHGCFKDCSQLVNVNIPSSVTSIGYACFEGCTSLEAITIPSSVTSLDGCIFMNCVSLTSLEFPSSFTFFGTRCFSKCANLESIVIPASVENLGQGSFYCCENIKTVRFLGKVPKIIESDLIKTASLYVPKDYLQDYKKAIGNKYPKIYAWTGDAEHPLCEVPSIAYSDGNLQFACNTPGAQVHYSISSADIVTDALADDGKVSLVAAYDISAYATAEHYEKSDSEYATIYWLPTNDGSSTGIKQTETRGIMVSSHDNVISVTGLDEGETISLYTIDGKLIGNAKASGGMASCTVTEPIVVVKIGELSIKITIR